MQNFQDKVILITGATGGFGSLMAKKLFAAGAKLALGDLDIRLLGQLKDSLPGDVLCMRCDVTQESEVQQLSEAAIEAFGRLDIAINNAGISSPMKGLLETTEEDMDLNFAVNAKGVFFGMKHQIPFMQTNRQSGNKTS